MYYLSWAAVETSCWFTGKAAKRIFWNSGKLICYADAVDYVMKFKTSHCSYSIEKIVSKTFGILTGKQMCWSLFLIKLQSFRADFISLWLKLLSYILKMYLIQSNCLEVPFFTQLTLLWKNLQLWELWKKKSFANNIFFFFWNSKLCNGTASSIKSF